jgi:chorismate--pyruvate lyase
MQGHKRLSSLGSVHPENSIQETTMQRATTWQSFRIVPHSVMPVQWNPWVLDRGSLTQRLVKASSGAFKVRVTSLEWACPTTDESQKLCTGSRQKALIREVDLLCLDRVVVRARSVIPAATLTGEERQLRHLGSRPLGAFLFSSRAMLREPLELAGFRDEYRRMMYGRRSVFLLHGKPLLVSEIFLPELLSLSSGTMTKRFG